MCLRGCRRDTASGCSSVDLVDVRCTRSWMRLARGSRASGLVRLSAGARTPDAFAFPHASVRHASGPLALRRRSLRTVVHDGCACRRQGLASLFLPSCSRVMRSRFELSTRSGFSRSCAAPDRSVLAIVCGPPVGVAHTARYPLGSELEHRCGSSLCSSPLAYPRAPTTSAGASLCAGPRPRPASVSTTCVDLVVES